MLPFSRIVESELSDRVTGASAANAAVSSRDGLLGDQTELVAARALNQFRQLYLEPRAATLAAQLIQPLRGDGSPLFFADFYSGVSNGRGRSNARVCASADLALIARVSAALCHNPAPHSYTARRADAAAVIESTGREGRMLSYSSTRAANVKEFRPVSVTPALQLGRRACPEGGGDVPSACLPKLHANIPGAVRLLARYDRLCPFLSGLLTEPI